MYEEFDYSEPSYILKQKLDQLIWNVNKNKVKIIINLINELFNKKYTCLSKFAKLYFQDIDNIKEKHALKILDKYKKDIKTQFNYKIPKYNNKENELSEFIINILHELSKKSGYKLIKHNKYNNYSFTAE